VVIVSDRARLFRVRDHRCFSSGLRMRVVTRGVGIAGAETGAVEREQSVDDKAEQRKQRQQPHVLGHRPCERM
jgi:hypothetical protein